MSGVPLDPEMRVRSISDAFLRPLWLPARLVAMALVGLWCVGAVLVARLGTDWARAVAGAAIVLAFLLALGARRWAKKRRNDATQGLSRALVRIDADLAGRASRALRLLHRSRARPEEASEELSRLHLSKTLEGVTEQQVLEEGMRLRTRRLAGAALLLFSLFGVLLVKPLEVIEGVDVLLARGGFGPFPMAYVDELQLTAQWPAYLDGSEKTRPVFTRLTSVPQGTELEVRVVPVVEHRKLVLTDGLREVPLVSDGRGAYVAQWLAEEPASLKVAARFGDVLLFDAHRTQIDPLEDRPPEVVLEGAPERIAMEDVDRLPLDYLVSDDYGLTQVDLVLLSGQRSVREELARLDGQTRNYRGGHALSRDHEMLRDAFLPVAIRIEARDGNTATGPSWGRSQEILLIPQPLGAEVAERHEALRSFRSALTNYLADEMNSTRLTHREAVQERKLAHERLVSQLDEMDATFADHREPPLRSLAFIRGQVEALGRTGGEQAAPDSVLLAVDALIHRLGGLEATKLAKSLGESIEELAVQIRQLRYDPQSVRRQGLFDLLAGNKQGAARLYQVGHLGLDLGSVARGDLARVETTLRAHEYARAEAAALHLAERLQRATPSFSSSGGSPGVESGSGQPGRGGQPRPGPASDAPSELQKMVEEMQGVAQDNAAELTELERLLQEAEQAARDDFEPDAEMEAELEDMRDALSELPSVGRGPGTASSEAATGRSQGESMADALEGGDVEEAVALGRDAEAALERAAELLDRGFGWIDDRSVERARDAVKKLRQRVEQAAQQQDRSGPGLAEGQWQERALRQKDLAERTQKLAERGRDADTPLPDASSDALQRAAELMRRAEQKLKSRDLAGARDSSSDAQRALEQAMLEPSDSDRADSGGESGDGDRPSTSGNVPDEERDRAREFRERVERGLGRGSGRLAPAVRRYAEDLK